MGTGPDMTVTEEQDGAVVPFPDPQALFRPDARLAAGLRLKPYQSFAPGLLMGWPETEPVEVVLRQVGDGPALEIAISGCEAAHWLTLEIETTWETLLARQYAGVALDIASDPISDLRVSLRVPRAEGGHDDLPGRRAVLAPEMQRILDVVQLPFAPERAPLDWEAPKVILWLSREPKVLTIPRLLYV